MPKPGRGRKKSSATSTAPRSASTGRVQKSGKQTTANTAAIAKVTDGIDPNLLHADYRPAPRSPILTRGKTASAGSVKDNEPSGSKSSGGIPTRNQYEPLSGEEDEEDDASMSSDNDDNGPAHAAKENNNTRSKERRPPPIYCLGHLADDIDELLEGQQYCLKLGKAAVQVITLNKKSFVGVKKILHENRINFYTFNPGEDVPVKIVLQGYKDREISELEDHLSDANVRPREIKILSRKSTVTGTHTLYLLYFDRGTVKLQDLRRIKTLDGFWVTWRYYAKHPSDAAQCHRCQKFGHGSRNCNLQPRCVKCGEPHLSEECSLPRKAELGDNAGQLKARVKCANCKGNHTSNYRGCISRKSYLEELEKRKKKAASTRPPQRSTSGTVPAAGTVPASNSAFPPGWGRTYASVAASGSGNSTQQANVTGEDLFTLPEFFALAGDMLTRFRTCRNKAEQFMALGELMIKYIYG